MKLLHKILDNSLIFSTIFLIVFIPLYPKLPLQDIVGTWVNIRLEDYVILLVGLLWGIQFLRKKVNFSAPLSLPIILFWVVGALSTLYAIFLIFPSLSNVSWSLAVLHFARRIEYLMLFFIAFSALRKKEYIRPVIISVIVTLGLVIFYGFGQKIRPEYFYAFSTMNEEFSKGIPLRLSPLARIPSTFAGHYDLAAYLVLIIPLIGSISFGVKKWGWKIFHIVLAALGLCLLLLTESRVSFAVYLLTISFMLFIQNKKWLVLPVLIISLLIAVPFNGFMERFAGTITQVDQIVDARTGKVIGTAKPDETGKELVIEDTLSTGENLPRGSGYINVPGEIQKGPNKITVKRLTADGKVITDELRGEFGTKKGYAFDVSWTTRFQGEWPRAIDAFKRNILLGSGYSSISLATDGDYLRLLGEVGLFGFASFLLIFLTFFLYVRKIIPDVDDPLSRSFVLGVTAGVFGILMNATLIDVFEASKVAYTQWLLIGCAVGVLSLYQKQAFSVFKEVKNALFSPIALALYLGALTIGIWSVIMGNFFIGDDYTWIRWAAECQKVMVGGVSVCETFQQSIVRYFTDSAGFFYRPGTKVLISILYSFGTLNPFSYHLASLVFHIATVIAVFMTFYLVTKNKLLSFIIGLSFVAASGYHEAIFWISSIGHIASSYFILGGLVFYLLWKEQKNILLLLLSLAHVLVAPLFQEMGIVAPLLIIGYELIQTKGRVWKEKLSLLFLLQIPLYLTARTLAQSFQPHGDYSYNLLKLPFNVFGNLLGYLGLILGGVESLPLYNTLRLSFKTDLLLSGIITLVILPIGIWLGVLIYRNITKETKYIVFFSLLLFLIPLLPFLGLGNIAERYSYLATAGLLGAMISLLYEGFISKKKKGLTVIFGLFILGFTSYHLSQIQKLNGEWHVAGQISDRTVSTTSELYQLSGKPANTTFYFVNTPTKYKHAWVFPTGLADGMWLAFQNNPPSVRLMSTLEAAVKESDNIPNARILLFDESYSLYEAERN